MEENNSLRELNDKNNGQSKEFISFSKKDADGNIRETIGYYEKNNIVDMLRQLQEKEEQQREQGGKTK